MKLRAPRGMVRGFSLIELLMAIFILGIGLVSIAALFPAGIVLQQRSEDEFNGPVVADWAIGLLRDRLDPEDFGSWWDFVTWSGQANGNVTQAQMLARVALDADADLHPAAWLQPQAWPWLRPALITECTDQTLEGAVDIFNATGTEFGPQGESAVATTVGEHTAPISGQGAFWQRFLSFDPYNDLGAEPELIGIPFNRLRHQNGPPRIFIHESERAWPPGSGADGVPRYFWDCAFRRVGRDRVQAAIFVYRVKRESLSSPRWTAQAVVNDNGTSMPAVPYRLSIADVAPPNYPGWAAGLVGDESFFEPGGEPGGDPDTLAGLPGLPTTTPDIHAPEAGWQHRGQWLLDQNGGIHRVTAGRSANDLEVPVVLSAPIPQPAVTAATDFSDEDGDGRADDMRRFSAARALPASVMFVGNAGMDWPTGLVRDFGYNEIFNGDEPDLDPWTAQGNPLGRFNDDPPVVDTIWYIPPVVEANGFRYELEPIYVSVEDL